MMVNDLLKPSRCKLVLALESPEGKQVVGTEGPFAIPSMGQMTYPLTLAIPHAPGKYLLKGFLMEFRHRAPGCDGTSVPEDL
jgi:hypothetical protein